MPLTYSTMVELKEKAPNFSLPDVISGRQITIETFADKRALLVMFICAHCPFVKHVQSQLAQIGMDYRDRSVGIVAISSSDVNQYLDDRPENLKKTAENLGYVFPFCYDESQEVAKSFKAACTPDFFLYDQERSLVYRGQLDASRPQNRIPTTGTDLRRAMDATLSGEAVSLKQIPSLGCNIKWRPGNEPSYFKP